MSKKHITLLIIGIFLMLNNCSNPNKEPEQKEVQKVVFASDILPFYDNWNLILGDGSNVGHANKFEHEAFFFYYKR